VEGLLVGQLMDGFPPSTDEQVTLANWRTYPYMRWSFQHVRELVPSAEIANDPDEVEQLSFGQADANRRRGCRADPRRIP
jgi:hypothetical protein